MIYETLKNRKYVREYDAEAEIPESLIDSMLRKTWEVTPSKNNFMAYTVHVVGPEHRECREKVFRICLANEGKVDQVEINNLLDDRYKGYLPQYSNILSCSYLLILTMRLETQPNPFQQFLIDRGHKYEAIDENKLNSMYSTCAFEAGMFCDTFSGMCLENGIDASFTGCFGKNLEAWKDVPFVTKTPLMIMTVGKGTIYRQDTIKGSLEEKDLRPDYERIVNFVK